MRFTHLARPWTLNQERSMHVMKHRSLTNKWRAAFANYGKDWISAGNQTIVGLVDVVVIPEVRNRTRPDTAACVGAAKAAIDGLVDAHVLVDDDDRYVRQIAFRPPKITGRDALTIELRPAPGKG